MKTLFCIIGRSATGKDTLTNTLCEELQMTKVVSHTTRLPRAGERDGVNYYFSTEKDYLQALDEESICAHTQIGENYYWTTYEEVLNRDFYVIDPLGLESLLRNLQHLQIRIVTIYITAPEKSRSGRALLRERARYASYIKKCMAEDEQFIHYEKTKEYDYCVHNVHFKIALEQLKTIIKEEKENIYAV